MVSMPLVYIWSSHSVSEEFLKAIMRESVIDRVRQRDGEKEREKGERERDRNFPFT